MEQNLADVLAADITVNPTVSISRELFSFLALINAYVPEFYLPMQQCQQILGQPDPIHGGPPFEEQMKPFTSFIKISREGVSMDQEIAREAVEKLDHFGFNRSETVNSLIVSLCGPQTEPCIIQLIKKMLTKRQMGKNGKEKFSGLITDILGKESFDHAVSVLTFASDKFQTDPYYPQAISRLYHKEANKTSTTHFSALAEKWVVLALATAHIAVARAPNNSYMADTLGRVYKKRLIDASEDILRRAQEAFKAFKDVERKAENEISSKTMDTDEAEGMSVTFNNRGLFNCIKVAKLAFKKLKGRSADIYPDIKTEVETKFAFFEWYLTYSKPDMSTSEPHYFWRDVALCYEHYTKKKAADSTSFPGLLLNHGLFMSKERSARFQGPKKTVSYLETIQEWLKAAYKENKRDIKLAERYILSNILLSNKMPDSPKLSPVNELKMIIHTFLGREKGSSRPEFYLLVLMLFWPENQNNEEVGQKATEDSKSADSTWEDNNTVEEQNGKPGEPAQLPADLMFDLNLQQYVTFMEEAFKNADYAKYLRGRYLLPLFFLGKGSGLSKWIHRSRLEAIVEEKVDSELNDQQNENIDWKEKERLIHNRWISGEVWHIPEITDMLLPVQIEPSSSAVSQENEEQEVCVCVGGQKIKARTEAQQPESTLPSRLFYLGFTIQGPVVFEVGVLNSDSDRQ